MGAVSDVDLTGGNLNGNNTVIYSKFGDIDISNSQATVNGLIYAPFGTVTIDCDNFNMNGLIIAQNVVIDGYGANINYSSSWAELVGTESEELSWTMDDWQYLADTDEDGLPNLIEKEIGSDPYNPDTDGDGLPDGYMIKPSSYEDVELFENCLPEEQVVEQKDGTFRNVCIIELFGAREHCCGDHYREIMNRWLPYGKQLEQLKHRICVQGTNTLKGIYPNVKINDDKKEKINLIESKFSNYEIKSYQSIPRNYVDENIIRTVQDQIEQFSKYLDEIKLCITAGLETPSDSAITRSAGKVSPGFSSPRRIFSMICANIPSNARSSVIFVNMSSVSAAFLYYCVAFLYIKIPEYRQVDIYHSQSSCSSATADRSAAIQPVCAF